MVRIQYKHDMPHYAAVVRLGAGKPPFTGCLYFDQLNDRKGPQSCRVLTQGVCRKAAISDLSITGYHKD